MRMIELPSPKTSPRPSRRRILAPPPSSRAILAIALMAAEDPTMLGPNDIQMLARAMLGPDPARATQ